MNASKQTTQEPHEFHHQELAAAAKPWTRWVRRAVITLLLIVVLIPPAAAFYSYFTGVPLHLPAGKEEAEARLAPSAARSISLVDQPAHTVIVAEEVAETLGIKKGDHDAVADAKAPTTMRPLAMAGSTRLDPTRLARIKARFAPARVVEIAQVHDFSFTTDNGRSEFHELRPGDHVKKGDVLAVFYSVDVQNTKNDLLDSLVQLQLDQEVLDDVEQHLDAVPKVFYLTQLRLVKGDRNDVNRAMTTLRLWDIPQQEIDDLHELAKKISSGKSDWARTPEGQWAQGEKQAEREKNGSGVEHDNPMGRVTLRAPFDGVVIERNFAIEEMVVDNTVNLFMIADVRQLQVVANCPEDMLPALQDLRTDQQRWTVVTAGAKKGLPGAIDQIQYVIDPNQHTAVVTGYFENPGERLRGGQYATCSVDIPPPDDVVEIPSDALVDDGRQGLVFVQPDPKVRKYTMRRVEVVQRFVDTIFVRSAPIPTAEQDEAAAEEVEARRLPKQPLLADERVLTSGVVELKAATLDLESRRLHERQAARSDAETGGDATKEGRHGA